GEPVRGDRVRIDQVQVQVQVEEGTSSRVMWRLRGCAAARGRVEIEAQRWSRASGRRCCLPAGGAASRTLAKRARWLASECGETPHRALLPASRSGRELGGASS